MSRQIELVDKGQELLERAMLLRLPGLNPLYREVVLEAARLALETVVELALNGGQQAPQAKEVVVVDHEGPRPAPSRKRTGRGQST